MILGEGFDAEKVLLINDKKDCDLGKRFGVQSCTIDSEIGNYIIDV